MGRRDASCTVGVIRVVDANGTVRSPLVPRGSQLLLGAKRRAATDDLLERCCSIKRPAGRLKARTWNERNK